MDSEQDVLCLSGAKSFYMMYTLANVLFYSG